MNMQIRFLHVSNIDGNNLIPMRHYHGCKICLISQRGTRFSVRTAYIRQDIETALHPRTKSNSTKLMSIDFSCLIHEAE